MPSEPERPCVDGPLDDVNDAFHDLYDEARTVAANEPPVLVVLADSLVLFHNGERRESSYAPKLLHLLKSASHAPVALYSVLFRASGGALAGEHEKLRALRSHVARSLADLDADVTDDASRNDVQTVLEATLLWIDRILLQPTVSDAQRDELGRLGPVLLRLIDEATRLQLAALHASASELLAALSTSEREHLQVVVTGDHQARVRSLGMQYFQKLLHEPEGSEERVAYAEGVSDEAEARELVGTRRLDRELAATFFGDPKRMQRDLLGDAAKAHLSKLDL